MYLQCRKLGGGHLSLSSGSRNFEQYRHEALTIVAVALNCGGNDSCDFIEENKTAGEAWWVCFSCVHR